MPSPFLVVRTLRRPLPLFGSDGQRNHTTEERACFLACCSSTLSNKYHHWSNAIYTLLSGEHHTTVHFTSTQNGCVVARQPFGDITNETVDMGRVRTQRDSTFLIKNCILERLGKNYFGYTLNSSHECRACRARSKHFRVSG